MNSLDEKITGALRDRADGYIDVESLLAGAQQRGRRHLRLRRASGAAIAAGTVAAVIVGAVIALSPTHGHRGTAGGPSNTTGATPSATPNGSRTHAPDGVPRPPDAGPGATPASADPNVIASDARLFHLDIDLSAAALPAPVTAFVSTSQTGSETLELRVGPTYSEADPRITATREEDSLFHFQLSQPPRKVKVNGVAALMWHNNGFGTETVIWQVLPGVWAAVTYVGEEATIRVAEAVRFDHVMRCTVPFTLATVAPNARMDSCTVTVDAAGVTANADVQLTQGWMVIVQSAPEADAEPVHPTTTVNGHPASTRQDPSNGGSGSIEHIRVDYGDRVIEFIGFTVHGPTVLQVAQGYRPIAGDDPSRWPSSPLP